MGYRGFNTLNIKVISVTILYKIGFKNLFLKKNHILLLLLLLLLIIIIITGKKQNKNKKR